VNPAIVQYCENCGKPLNAKARFCGRCGRAVPQPSSAPMTEQPYVPTPVKQFGSGLQPLAAPPPGEFIITALPVGVQQSGFLGIKAEGFVLVLTNLRILVAKQTAELMKENARQAKEAAKQGGQGLFGQWGAVIGSSGSQRYLQMQPQEILNETAGNYFIANNQVRSAQVKEHYDPEDARSDTRLTLDLVGGKLELNYSQASQKEIKQALQQTLGNLVR
jgi:hypothetical protein